MYRSTVKFLQCYPISLRYIPRYPSSLNVAFYAFFGDKETYFCDNLCTANTAQRTLNVRWCQYGTKDIKCQVMPTWCHLVIDVVKFDNGKCHLGTIWPLTAYVLYWHHLVFGVVCALLAQPGPHRINCMFLFPPPCFPGGELGF